MDTDNDKTAIRVLIEAIHQAHHDRDAAAIAAPYAPHAAIFDLSPPLAHDGVDPHHKAAWLATWDGPIERRSRDFEIMVCGDLAVCHGYFQLSGTPKAAGQPISFWMRATVCLERSRNGAWRIVHEHESVPFYMDGSLRPAFDLEP